MNKLDRFFEMTSDYNFTNLVDRLIALVEQNRITTGCLLLYNPNNFYPVVWGDKLHSKAAKAKNSVNYLNDHITNAELDRMEANLKELWDEAIVFVTEQETLPFEDTQKQQLLEATS